MNFRNRATALILCIFTMASFLTPVMAEEEQWDAYYVFGSTIQTKGLTAQSKTQGMNHTTGEIDGKSYIQLVGNSWTFNSVFLKLNSAAVKGLGGKHVLVEVEYYDDSADNWFQIIYNNRDEQNKYTKRGFYKGSKQWEKQTFVMEAPSFAGDLNNCDFSIAARIDDDWSHGGAYIHSVKLKQLDTVSPAHVRVNMDDTVGHNFFSDEPINFKVDIKNKLAQDFDATLKLTLCDPYDKEVYVQTEEVSLKSLETVTKDITLGLEKFGVYTVYAELENAELNYKSTDITQMAYIVKSEFMNYRFGVTNHFIAWGSPYRDPDTLYDLMEKAGIGWSRDEILWQDYEKEPGVYKLTDFHTAGLESLRRHPDIKQLLILAYGNTLYTQTSHTVPSTPETLEKFKQYCKHLVGDVKGLVNHFEYWNEYDSSESLEYYINIAKASYEGVKEANPEAKTIGFTSVGVGECIQSIKTCFDMGGAKYMDDISYHRYPIGSPDTVGVVDNTKSIRDALDLYPEARDKKIWLTEMGWSTGEKQSFTNGDQKPDAAKYIGKQMALQFGDNLCDVIMLYDMVEDGDDPTATEHAFGILNHYTPGGAKVPFLAQCIYVAIAAMNNCMGTPEWVENKMFKKDSIYAYHYKRQQDQKDVGVFWAAEGCENQYTSIKLDSDNVKFCDKYGNPIAARYENGEYYLVINDEPVYAVGDFNAFEEGKTDIYISNSNISCAEHDKVNVYIYKANNKNLSIKVDAQDNDKIKIINDPQFRGNVAHIYFSADGIKDTSTSLPFTLYDEEGNIYYEGKVSIKFADSLKVSGRTRLFSDSNTKRWILDLDVLTNFHQDGLTGTFQIIEPAALDNGPIKLGELKPGVVNNSKIHLPEIPEFTSYSMKAKIVLSNGVEQVITMPIDFALAYKTDKPPVIDGKMDEGEWMQEGKIVSKRQDQVVLLNSSDVWRGEKDLSADTYIMWDDDYLYLACRVLDDIFSCEYTGSQIWSGDSLQFGLAYNRENSDGTPSTLFTEVGIGLTPEGVSKVKYGVESGTSLEMTETEAAVTRKDNYTTYEVKMPWSEAVPKDAVIGDNVEIGYSMLVNDNDTTGRRGWIEFGSGIGMYKAANEFARIRLVPLK